jgi:hypothetical protein
MIPAGYLAKKVALREDWLAAAGVDDIYSVSGCLSKDFVDYIPHWKHNGYWLFNSVADIQSLARELSIDLSDCRLFYYEIFELELDEETMKWQAFEPEPFGIAVVPPAGWRLEGYDVVSFYARSSAECSPLSCNSLAETIPTNRHCLLETLDEAKQLLEGGAFADVEPGPFRIFAVYSR